ncbi:hypothetical protein JW710_02505 [Candidatus Dojkabacteria bacterium]|nr:hypothetical protein [Candidatus Dojkabacteria bacterium]
MKLKRLIIIAGAALATYITISLLSYFFDGKTSPEIPNTHQTLFFTGIYPKKVLWINKQVLVALEENSIIIYDTNERTVRKKIEINQPIIDIQVNSEKIFIISKDNDNSIVYKISENGEVENTVKFPKADTIVIQDKYSCHTKSFEIKSPEEVASIITIYKDRKIINEIRSSLSVKPLNCDSKKLYLVKSSPVLENHLYSWENNKIKNLTLNREDILSIGISQNMKLIAIETDTSIEVLSDSSKIINSANYNGQPWYLTPNKILFLENSDNRYEVKSYILEESEKKIETIFESEENFTDIIPSPDENNFILLSEFGELWISKRK